MIDLAIGESTTDIPPVRACKRWNPSGLLLRAGATYEIKVIHVEGWRDWYIQADPGKGHLEQWPPFNLRVVDWFRRHRESPWLALVGAVGKERGSYFGIGMGTRHTPDWNGELLTFANDGQ